MKNLLISLFIIIVFTTILNPKVAKAYSYYYVIDNEIYIPIYVPEDDEWTTWDGTSWKILEDDKVVYEGMEFTTDIINITIPKNDTSTHNFILKKEVHGNFKDDHSATGFRYEDIRIDYIGNRENLTQECVGRYYYAQCKMYIDLMREGMSTYSPANPNMNIEAGNRYASDPVDVTSGNFYLSEIDFDIKTAGIPLIIERRYDSIYGKRRWKFNVISEIDTRIQNEIRVYWGNGSNETFLKTRNNWKSKYGTSVMTKEGDVYTVKTLDNTKFKFIDGKLVEVLNEKNLGYKYIYGENYIVINDSFDNLLVTINTNADGKIIKITDASGHFTSYTYNEINNIVSYTSREGNTTNYEYNAEKILYKIVGPDGNVYVENEYDEKGRVLSQKDGSGHKTQFEYDTDDINYMVSGTTVTYPDGSVQHYRNKYNRVESKSQNDVDIKYEYDKNRKISKLIDQAGNTWDFERDEKGKVTKFKDPLGNKNEYLYDENGNLVEIKNPIGEKMSFEYDENNNIIKIVYPDGSKKTFEYNDKNLLTKSTNQLGNYADYQYDKRGFVSKVSLPNNQVFEYTYDVFGNPIQVKNQEGNVTAYTYDKQGNIIKITDAQGNELEYKYNDYNDIIESKDSDGNITKYEYDGNGLLKKVFYPDGSYKEYEYNSIGRLVKIKDALDRETKIEYDEFGRKSKVTLASGRFAVYGYNKSGKLESIVDSEGNEIKTKKDALGKTTESFDVLKNIIGKTQYNALGLPEIVTDGLDKTLEFDYDTLGRLKKATLSGTIEASAEYDKLGQLLSITDPLGGDLKYTYDKLGNIIKETNQLGDEFEYSYTLTNELKSSKTPNGAEVNYTYNKIGLLTNIKYKLGKDLKETTIEYTKNRKVKRLTNESGTVEYEYDSMGRVVKRKGVFGLELAYTYDLGGRLKNIIYPDGKVVEYEYNDDDRVTKIRDFLGNETNYIYDSLGNLEKAVYPNGFYTYYTYDKNGKIASVKNFSDDGELLSGDSLYRDKIGNITENFKETLVEPNIENVLQMDFTVNSANQIEKANGKEFKYDKDGNLIEFYAGSTKIELNYDQTNNLTNAKIGEDNFNYTYDAQGYRVKRVKNEKVHKFVIDDVLGLSKPLVELNEEGEVEKYYIYSQFGLVYSVDKEEKYQIYFYDYKGNTSFTASLNGEVLNAYNYSIYGVILGSIETVQNDYKTLGKYGIISDSSGDVYYNHY